MSDAVHIGAQALACCLSCETHHVCMITQLVCSDVLYFNPL